MPSLSEGKAFADYVTEAKNLIANALVDSGLYADEARAMVNTWEKSYFQTPGIRVLYVLPRNETERILPMTVTPAPRNLVRTLVGRVEVMTQNQEEEYLRLLLENPDSINREKAFGRFYEPKLRRLLEASNQNRELSTSDRNRIASKIESLLE